MYETRLRVLVGAEVGRKKLDRYIAIEIEVTGPVDYTHAPLTEHLQDLVVRYRLPYQGFTSLRVIWYGRYARSIENVR